MAVIRRRIARRAVSSHTQRAGRFPYGESRRKRGPPPSIRGMEKKMLLALPPTIERENGLRKFLTDVGTKSVCQIGIWRRIDMHILFGILYLLGNAIALPTSARADECANSHYTPHHKGAHKFATSSAVENDGQTPAQHWTCVRNLNKNSDHDVKITWYIPGPYMTWIPGGVQVDTPRRPLDDKQMSIRGCLRYGNLRDFVRAEFVGSEEEANRVKEEEGGESAECGIRRQFHERPASKIVRGVPAIDWLDSFRIFFPSDLTNASDTMLRLDASLSVKFHDK